jgi:hypothetical protein
MDPGAQMPSREGPGAQTTPSWNWAQNAQQANQAEAQMPTPFSPAWQQRMQGPQPGEQSQSLQQMFQRPQPAPVQPQQPAQPTSYRPTV